MLTVFPCLKYVFLQVYSLNKSAEHILQQYLFPHLFTCKHSHLGAAQCNISPRLFCSWQSRRLSNAVALEEERGLASLSLTHFPLPTLSFWGLTSRMWPSGQQLSSLIIKLSPPHFVISMLTPYSRVDESAMANSESPFNELLKVYTGCFCWMSSKELTLQAETSFLLAARWIRRLSQARGEERRGVELLSHCSTWIKDRQDGTETSVKHRGRHTHTDTH